MTQAKRGWAGSEVSDLAWAFLHDAVPVLQAPTRELWELQADLRAGEGPGAAERLWRQFADAVLENWVADKPGTRPSLWWKYDAPRSPIGTYPGRYWDGTLPEPRRRVGGTGTPSHEVLAYVPEFAFGIPTRWIDQWLADYYNGRAKDIHGKPIGQEFVGRPFAGLPIDPANPPRYEAQATYLKRHGLLLPAELGRLGAADWRAEVVG